MVKYIIVPNYCPLYAMSKCFGPTHGPLTKPCPTPVDIIRELLLQTGVERVHIYEVGYDATKRTTYGEPVQLNMSNYQIPYEQLVRNSASKYAAGEVVTTEMTESKPVTPTVIEAKIDPIIEYPDEEPAVFTKTVDPIIETKGEESTTFRKTVDPTITFSESVEVETSVLKDGKVPVSSTAEMKEGMEPVVAQPTKRMSKAERRALRRQTEQAQQSTTSEEKEDVIE